jgi:hypothetical protein
MPRKGDPGSALVAAALTGAVQQDTELQTAARRLAWSAISMAEELLESGSIDTRLKLLHTFMPAIAKALNERNDDDRYEQLREEFKGLVAEMKETRATPVVEPAAAEVDARPAVNRAVADARMLAPKEK